MLCFVEADWPLVGGSFTTRKFDFPLSEEPYMRLLHVLPTPNPEPILTSAVVAL